jgi:hypothetical protein
MIPCRSHLLTPLTALTKKKSQIWMDNGTSTSLQLT